MYAIRATMRELGADTPLGVAFLTAVLGLICFMLATTGLARLAVRGLSRGLVRPELSPEEDYEEDSYEEDSAYEEEEALRGDREVVVCVSAAFFMKGGAGLIRTIGTSCAEVFRVVVLFDPYASASYSRKVCHEIASVPNSEKFLVPRFLVGSDRLGVVLRAYGAHLYLGVRARDVTAAMAAGVASAHINWPLRRGDAPANELRVAFDGDAVIFSNESEQVFRREGLTGFRDHEDLWGAVPLEAGPFQSLLRALGKAQRTAPIKTYLVTARGSGPERPRAMLTLAAAGLNLTETVFQDGAPKGPALARIAPHIFFDDTQRHVDDAVAEGILAGQVPYEDWIPAESNIGRP